MRFFLRLWWFGGFLLAGLVAEAQRPLVNPSQQAALNRLSRAFGQDRNAQYQQAVQLARQRHIPLRQTYPDGTVVILAGMDERGNLLFNSTGSTTLAARTTHTSALYKGGSLGLSLSGADPAVRNKLAIWDGGKVRASHVELTGRVTQADEAATVDNHATHVSGIMISAGLNERVRGMAFGAQLKAYDFSNNAAEIAAAAPDLLLSNHSYNIQAGWLYNANRSGDVKWEWHGDTTVSTTEDYKFGIYNVNARNLDQIAVNAPYHLLVKSAGNTHGQNGPGTGASYWLVNRGAVSQTPRNDQNGYDQISTDSNAKNILSVGAVSNIPTEYTQPADVKLAGFSSWGPSDDGRIKPDLVGVGVNVLSTGAASDNAYTILSGTSMSAPNVTGSLLLLQEYYVQLHAGQLMRSSTLRGLALHTTDEAGDAPGPDYRFGWGLLNTERAARVVGNSDKSHLLEERTLNQGEIQTVRLVSSGRGPLVVTICWTDPAGTALTASMANLNNRSPRLVNDLDIRISDGSQTRLPWVLDPANPSGAATTGDNIRDNVEQILIADAVPGKIYTLTIAHKATLQNSKQDFALLASGIGGQAYCTSGAATAGGVNIDRVRFGAIDQAGLEGCQTYTDFTGLVASVSVRQQIPLTVSIGNCAGSHQAIVKAYIDWNLDADFDDPGEGVATSTVLTAPAQFSAIVTIPGGLVNGQVTRMRLVTTETTDAGSVVACGLYPAGETQDYLVRFVRPANDLGITALSSPEAGFCVQNDLVVAVQVRNYGSAEQRNVPVSVRITAPDGTLVGNLTQTLNQLLGPGKEVQVLLRSAVRLQAGTAYRFTASMGLTTDQDTTNNRFEVVRTAGANVSGQGRFTAALCGNNPISLQNTGAGTAFWYDAPTGGSLLAAGNRTSTSARPANDVFYAGLNEFSGTLGPVGKQAFGGGTYSGNFGPQPLISAEVPLLLESARLYIGTAGRLTFTVRKLDETPVSTVTLDVAATRNPATPAGSPPSGQLSDDPTDPGAEYVLNLRIPEPGTYKIGIEYEDGASIFRSNVGVTGFPFQLPGVMTLKGSLFNTSGRVDTLTTAYYYFYSLKVKALGCPAPQRVAVSITTGTPVQATLVADGSTDLCEASTVTLRVSAQSDYQYQWLRNGQLIANATSATLAVSEAGAYSVQITNACGSVVPPAITVTVKQAQAPTITRSGAGYLLTSNASTGNQWLLNGIPIPGATQPVYTATQSGKYAVRANLTGCGELVSAEIQIEVITATARPTVPEYSLRISPNPAGQLARVEFWPPSMQGAYTVRLIDAGGRVLQTRPLERQLDQFAASLDVSTLPPGTLFILVVNEKGQTVQRGKLMKL